MLLTRFFCHFKTWPKCIGMSFLCVIHGPQNCIKWMNIVFKCWNIWICIILLCFDPVNTTHLFLWEKIAPFGCGVMAILWIQTTDFDVCLLQSLNDSSGHLSNTQRHKWRLKIWFLMAKYTHCLHITKQFRNSIVRDENACFPVCWNLLKIFLHVCWTV